ncbi:hypothetical protein CONLIGDRAFT_691267 [Coniochaeta ligniaria NRRL 30616]|uniref:Cerato-platanin n=1 Tax=Coniochaeta ligniaria NRRL 30616 TaxID=1408157 RepID=A0A1J7ICA8_9PEZI|nr:hypothetical protein CONLIGDRAFT_691267 [Coniochaeta ligniaria NRRL 30616]
MHSTFFSTATLLAGAALTAAAPLLTATSISVTPHDMYSSSVGVLGCKINTDRVAYWPQAVDCNNICVKVSYGGRSVTLLRIDQSGGAYDVSYDAWNYLYTGQSAKTNPVAGGGIGATYEDLPAAECAGLMHDGRLALSAANSMNYLASCLNQPGSWVANNYVLYNIYTPTCTYGIDETCTLNWPSQNQATCPHQLGLTTPLTSQPVWNVQYPTGKLVLAT